MKFICDKESILKEISNAGDFTSQRNTVTVLASVYLLLNQDKLTIKTTDQKMGYVSELNVQGIHNGTTTVSCDKLLEILRNMPSDNIYFEQINDKIQIKPENSDIEFNLRTMDPSVFPAILLPEENSYFKIPQKDFTEMINQVIFAISDDESKYAMNGALLEKNENSLTMVGTDGRRLSFINRQLDAEIPKFENVTIPAKFLGIIKKHSVNEGSFDISVTDVSVYIKTSQCIIFSNLIKNEFPAYRRVIPDKQTKKCIINNKALDSAIKRVSLLVENKCRKIIMEFSENKLKLYTEETEMDFVKEEIPCQYTDEPMIFGMNYMYILNPIRAINTENVIISFSEYNKPFTITSDPEADYQHIVMPMNVR